MYIILDKNLKRTNTLTLDDDTNLFWGETVERQIADDETNSDDVSAESTFNTTDPNANSKSWNDTINNLTVLADSPVASNLIVGNYIGVHDDTVNHWRIYRIYQTDETIDSTSGTHLKSCDAINLAIWRLGKTIPVKKEITECTLKIALEWIMAGTGWDVENNSTSGLYADVEFDGSSTSQSMLQTVLSDFDVEANAYVNIDSSGIVTDFILDIEDELGKNEGKRITYGDNMLSIDRQTVDTTLITKLYVYGNNGKSIDSVNNGANFITDSQANVLYNADPTTWLEGSITSSAIDNPAALLAWGTKTLRLFNHPRVNYSVETTQNFNPNLGDTIKVIDLAMNPILTTQARVIQKVTSDSDPSQNKVVLGEFSTVNVVTPSFIKNLEQRWGDHVRELFEEAKKHQNAASVSLITPLGTSWSNTDTSKKIIARLFIEGENVTSYLSAAAFNWYKIGLNETHGLGGTHDLVWEGEHKKDGYEVTITPPFEGNLMVTIDDKFVKKDSEMWVDTGTNSYGDFKRLWITKDGTRDFNGDVHVGALQYAILLSDGSVMSSYHYTKDKMHSDTEFIKWNADGSVQSMMFVVGGGHCGSFWYDESSNTIYNEIKDENDGKYYIGTLPYTPNSSNGSSNFTKWCSVPQYFRCSVDLENNVWMGSATDGTVYICLIDSPEDPDDPNKPVGLKQGTFAPIVEFKIQDFGLKPIPAGVTNHGTYNTMQANDISYPYAFFTSGDINNSDDKLLTCVNVITHSIVFQYSFEPEQDIALDVPIEDGGHMEPEGVYFDKANSRLIVGFNISEFRDEAHTIIIAHSALFEVPVGERDDSKDLDVEYPSEDQSSDSAEDEQAVLDDDTSTDIDDDTNDNSNGFIDSAMDGTSDSDDSDDDDSDDDDDDDDDSDDSDDDDSGGSDSGGSGSGATKKHEHEHHESEHHEHEHHEHKRSKKH